MSTSTVPFLIAKAHAYHSSSPTLEQVHSMAQANTLSEIESILQQTHYGKILSEVRPSVNLIDFEVALRRDYADLLTRYQRAASLDTSDMLKAFELTIEAENMNMILQAILRENVTDDLKNNIIPVGKFGMEYYERMMGTTRVDAAIDFILDRTLRKVAENAFQMSNDPDEQVFFLASGLSHAAYRNLHKIVPIWTKRVIETRNLITAARSVGMGIDPMPWMMDNGGPMYKAGPMFANMKSTREIFTYALNHHFPYPHLIEMALGAEDDKMVTEFEHNTQLERYYYHRRSFRIFGNRNESILDFFFIKKAEIEDISRILLGTLKGISTDTIMEMLALPLYRRKQT